MAADLYLAHKLEKVACVLLSLLRELLVWKAHTGAFGIPVMFLVAQSF